MFRRGLGDGHSLGVDVGHRDGHAVGGQVVVLVEGGGDRVGNRHLLIDGVVVMDGGYGYDLMVRTSCLVGESQTGRD